jgi:hypothetical protein
MEALEQEVLEERITPFRAARTLLEMYSDAIPAETRSRD